MRYDFYESCFISVSLQVDIVCHVKGAHCTGTAIANYKHIVTIDKRLVTFDTVGVAKSNHR